MNQTLKDYLDVCRNVHTNNPNVGLLVLAAAIDRVAKSIDELEIRVVTKKPEGL